MSAYYVKSANDPKIYGPYSATDVKRGLATNVISTEWLLSIESEGNLGPFVALGMTAFKSHATQPKPQRTSLSSILPPSESTKQPESSSERELADDSHLPVDAIIARHEIPTFFISSPSTGQEFGPIAEPLRVETKHSIDYQRLVCGVALFLLTAPLSFSILSVFGWHLPSSSGWQLALTLVFFVGYSGLWGFALAALVRRREDALLIGMFHWSLCLYFMLEWQEENAQKVKLLNGGGVEEAYYACCKKVLNTLQASNDEAKCASWYDIKPALRAFDPPPHVKLKRQFGRFGRDYFISFSSWVDINTTTGDVQRKEWAADACVYYSGEMWGTIPIKRHIDVNEVSFR